MWPIIQLEKLCSSFAEPDLFRCSMRDLVSSAKLRAIGWQRAKRGAAMLVVAVACAAQPEAARAALIVDPEGDFLPTYTGPQDAGLDVVADEVSFTADRLNFFGRMAGAVAPTQAIGGVYLFGLDRGQGTARFLNAPAAPPVIGPNVLFDSVLRINPDGTGQFVNIIAGSPPTALNPADITISGNEFVASLPLSLFLPGATRPVEQWTYNLWPRNGQGLNVQVSDLAPDNSNSPVVPEPGTCGVFGIGLALLGLSRRVGRLNREVNNL